MSKKNIKQVRDDMRGRLNQFLRSRVEEKVEDSITKKSFTELREGTLLDRTVLEPKQHSRIAYLSQLGSTDQIEPVFKRLANQAKAFNTIKATTAAKRRDFMLERDPCTG